MALACSTMGKGSCYGRRWQTAHPAAQRHEINRPHRRQYAFLTMSSIACHPRSRVRSAAPPGRLGGLAGHWAAALRALPILAIFIACPAWAGRKSRADKSDEILQMDRLLTIRLRLSAEQWRIMQPERASRLATAMMVLQHPTTQHALDAANGTRGDDAPHKAAVDGERRPPGLVGNEYAYVSAAADVDGRTYERVGLHFKGQWSYTLSAPAPRRPMKLSFDHFVDGQHFHGIRSLALNNSAADPSQLRDSLAYACFREAGVPASRTCFALVYLTVNGLYDQELLGLYTAVEEINKDFLHRHFGTSKGLLIRPERTRNFAYLGDRWEAYDRFNLQSRATPYTAERFMSFTRVIHLAQDEMFFTEIASYLDADEFLRFLAANVLMINLDGILVNGHNFYIYIHPETGRLSFIPWDLHYSFGARADHGRVGQPDHRAPLPREQPPRRAGNDGELDARCLSRVSAAVRHRLLRPGQDARPDRPVGADRPEGRGHRPVRGYRASRDAAQQLISRSAGA